MSHTGTNQRAATAMPAGDPLGPISRPARRKRPSNTRPPPMTLSVCDTGLLIWLVGERSVEHPGGLDKAPHPIPVLFPIARLDAGVDVYAPGLHPPHGLRDIVRRQAA